MTGQPLFADRSDAGRRLVEHLGAWSHRSGVVVVALPRGGVPVGVEVANALGLPLDVCIVRKLGVPGQRELAMGAVAPGGITVLNQHMIDALGICESDFAAVRQGEVREMRRREALYRGGRPPYDLRSKTVLLVDDGLATGSTMRAALASMRARGATRVVVALPVAAPEPCADLRLAADDVVCLYAPAHFQWVGTWYTHFRETSDEEVKELLRQATGRVPVPNTPNREGRSWNDR